MKDNSLTEEKAASELALNEATNQNITIKIITKFMEKVNRQKQKQKTSRLLALPSDEVITYSGQPYRALPVYNVQVLSGNMLNQGQDAFNHAPTQEEVVQCIVDHGGTRARVFMEYILF